MKLDPVPMECAKCKKETTHSVTFTEYAKAAGTLSAICSLCGNKISLPLTGAGGRDSISTMVKSISASGSYKRKIVKGDF